MLLISLKVFDEILKFSCRAIEAGVEALMEIVS